MDAKGLDVKMKNEKQLLTLHEDVEWSLLPFRDSSGSGGPRPPLIRSRLYRYRGNIMSPLLTVFTAVVAAVIL